MTGLDELSVQCERRGWRLALTARHVHHQQEAGMRVGSLEVRGVRIAGARELLASIPLPGVAACDYDAAALDLSASLAAQGLIS